MKKYILLLFWGLTLTLNAQKIELDVYLITQEQTRWCGVAASRCVLIYYNYWPLQCDIMEYVQKIYPAIYGYTKCCKNGSGDCNNKGLDFFGGVGSGSIGDVLEHFGPVYTSEIPFTQSIPQIRNNLTVKRPLIIQWANFFEELGHAVVIRGIDGNDILFMDPWPPPDGGCLSLPYNQFVKNGDWQWNGTIAMKENGPPPPPCNPAHCCNGQFEPELGEWGLDCGGTCPNECPPPPADKCSNCQPDDGEECIDCGGDDCKPCDDVPKERIVNNTTQLRKEVAAFNKITAKDNVVIQTGKQVSFITNNEGSIVLLPGFKAENGCTFTTQRKDDLSDYGRACGTICKLDYVSQQICFPESLKIYQLINAVRVDYYIYDKASGDRKYENTINVTSNGEIYVLWDCVAGVGIQPGTVWYIIEYYVYCCDGTYYKKRQEFYVNYFCYGKSSSDDPENPIPSLSSPANNLTHQNENTSPGFTIIPNPNPGVFQLETNFPLSEVAILKVVNSLGATVYDTQNLASNTIHLPSSASGQHFVMLILKEGTVLTQKMMIRR